MNSSILTNASAMTALQVLRKTNQDLSTTQNRISTGLKVATAKDNASFWAVSQVMKSDVGAFKAIGDNLSLAQASTSVARDGAEQIAELISEIKSLVTSAQAGSLDKKKIQADVEAKLSQIGEITKTANFNGVKLLESTDTVKLLSSLGRSSESLTASYIEFAGQNLTLKADGGLRTIDGLSILGRGTAMLDHDTDGISRMVIGAAATDMAAGDKLYINYTDKNGVGRVFTHTLKQAIQATPADRQKLIEELNESASFSSLFAVDYDAAADTFTLSAKDRDTNVTINSWSAEGWTDRSWITDFGAVSSAGSAGGDADSSVDFTFEFTDWAGKSVSITLDNVDTRGTATGFSAGGATDAANEIQAQLRTKMKELGYDLGADDARVNFNSNAELTSSIGTFTKITYSTPAGFALSTGETGTGTTATITGTAPAQQELFQFQDSPLRLGEDITLKYTVANVAKQITLRVTDDTDSGVRLDNQSDPDKITLALDARKVADAAVTGTTIAAEIGQALASLAGANAYGVDNTAASWNTIVNAGPGGPAGIAAVASQSVDFFVTDDKLTITSDVIVNSTAYQDTIEAADLPLTDYQSLLDNIELAYTNAINAAAALGSAQMRVDIQKDFVSSMVDNLKIGIGTLVDADMNEESARLQALQVQQQLGIQSLSIANQAPQMLLSLFK